MPDLSYTQLMAEMIAQAKPRRAGGQQLPTVAGSRMGIAGTQSYTNVGIDLGGAIEAFRKLTNYQPTEKLMEMAARHAERISGTPPEDRATLIRDPFFQEMLATLQKRNVPVGQFGFAQVAKTPLGKPYFDYVPGYEETTVSLKEKGRRAVYGPQAAATIAAKEAEIEAERPVREAQVERYKAETKQIQELLPLSLQVKQVELDKLNTEMSAIRQKLPMELHALEAERAYKEAEARLKHAEATHYPQRLKAEEAEHNARLALIRKQTAIAELEMAKTRQEMQMLEQGITKEERASIDKIQSDFDRFRNQWELNVAKLGVTPDAKLQVLQDLESITSSTIAAMHARVRDPAVAAKASEAPFRYWLSQIDVEMRKPLHMKGLVFKEVDPKDLERRRYYIRAAVSLLKQGGIRSSDIYDKLLTWANVIGMSQDELLNMMK